MGSNRFQFPPQEGPLDPSWKSPLEMVERAICGSDRLPSDAFFDVGDFMIMARLVRSGRPDIQMYKHIHTRRYISVDDAGHTYRYFPPRSRESGRSGSYRPHRSFRDAIEELQLWQLPWMKPELESHRRGLSWEDRWYLYDDETGDRSAVRRWQLCFTLPARTEPIGLFSGPGLPIGAWLGRVRCGRHGWRGRGQRRAR